MQKTKKTVFLFPGQGSQFVGMGKDFYQASTIARDMVDNASEKIKVDFKKLLFEENDKLERTEFTQPAILLISAIAHKIFEDEMMIRASSAMGHSLGEFSALVSIGALDYLDGVWLTHERGKLMQEDCKNIDAGMMALIGLSDEDVENIAKKARENGKQVWPANYNSKGQIVVAGIKKGKQVWPANYNSKGQIVVAGIKKDLFDLEEIFKKAGAKRAIVLNMSVASHCPLLASASDALKPYLQKFLRTLSK